MIFNRSALTLLVGATVLIGSSVSAFQLVRSSPLSSHQQLHHQATASWSLLSAATTDTEQQQQTQELLPEYQAALEKATASVAAVIAETQPELLDSVNHFCKEYMTASQASYLKYKEDDAKPDKALKRILEGVQFGYKYGMGPDKYTFGVTHDALRGDPEKENGNTFDYYTWGCDFFRQFMDKDDSTVEGIDNLKKAMDQAAAGENVVFFANHQSEADPQVMSMMLEKAGYEKEASQVIYVAGHKVTTDPLAIPFSMGRNLICIHS
jgi:glycerol-3-phosphate O-acyltransferase